MIANQPNPNALEAKHIKTTTTVVVLFKGIKVPNYLMCGVSLLRSPLYGRQTDVGYGCGGLNHRPTCAPISARRCAGGVGTSLLLRTIRVRRNVLFVGARTSRRTDCANYAFKFRTSLDAENGAGSAPGRFSNRWPRRAAHVTPAWQVFPGGGTPSRQLAVGAASPGGAPAPGGALVPGGGSRMDLPGRIEPSRSQRHHKSQRR
ncbi:hypothetical protein HPB48_010598 [Haemaphysalis longicornis]|uniref:Uncharacterized protein n=1 Tax=Haemaphysalis longicornis TaxID=44386 RepID=A0A9J6FUK4_HAELO|nr:hypothetical protein HPB48_010598 [Haemaphysalis longicornis]